MPVPKGSSDSFVARGSEAEAEVEVERAFSPASSSPAIFLKGNVIHGGGRSPSETNTIPRSSPLGKRKHPSSAQSPISASASTPPHSLFESRLPVRRAQTNTAAFRLPSALMSPSKSVAIASSMTIRHESLAASIGATTGAISSRNAIATNTTPTTNSSTTTSTNISTNISTNASTNISALLGMQGKVTPEKVLEELKAAAAERKRARIAEMMENGELSPNGKGLDNHEVHSPRKRQRKQTRPSMAVDEEISIPGVKAIAADSPKTELSEGHQEEAFRRRMSLRHVTFPVSDDIAGAWDPLEVARLTIVNTKRNSGYRQCRLVYRSEQLSVPRPTSPMHEFSGKQVADLRLSSDSSEAEALQQPPRLRPRCLRFNRKLHFSPDIIVDEPDLEVTIPLRSCLKSVSSANDADERGEMESLPVVRRSKEMIEVKRVVYADEVVDSFLDRKRTGRRPQSAVRRPLSAAKRTPVKRSNVK